MKKQIIGTVICIFLIIFTPQAIGSEIYNKSNSLITNKIETQIIRATDGGMWTQGPIRKWIAEINLIDGVPSEIERIEKILNRPKLRILPFAIIKVTNLDFSVTYKRNMIFLITSLTYSTAVAGFDTFEIIFNRAHTVTVNNLDGLFLFMKTLPLCPSRFLFFGLFEELTISK